MLRPRQPARLQGADPAPEHFASYWTPVPAGATDVLLRGQRNASGLPWWLEDVSVWSQTFNGVAPAPPPTSQPTPTPQPTPVTHPTPTATPAPKPTPTPTPVTTPPPPPQQGGAIAFRSASRSIYFA